MAPLHLEELGLLQVLERVQRGDTQMTPAIRYGLHAQNLIEHDPPVLTSLGKRVLHELRSRSIRLTGQSRALAGD